ncbi:MAG TPA: potassium-transporting ATPase subunit F [Thermoplasmata archaeon]|nr:potassium-transporting ATPase subunit F [Thermoplasmata archaeon]
MGGLAAVDQHLGLLVFTVVAVALVVYLTYSMVHPERF